MKTYKEFKKDYSWSLKHYYNLSDIYGRELFFDCVIENYTKTGRKWTLDNTTTDNNISSEYYMNTIESIPFFKNLGGVEKVSTKSSILGYIPFKIESISPDKTQKTIRTFIFKF